MVPKAAERNVAVLRYRNSAPDCQLSLYSSTKVFTGSSWPCNYPIHSSKKATTTMQHRCRLSVETDICFKISKALIRNSTRVRSNLFVSAIIDSYCAQSSQSADQVRACVGICGFSLTVNGIKLWVSLANRFTTERTAHGLQVRLREKPPFKALYSMCPRLWQKIDCSRKQSIKGCYFDGDILAMVDGRRYSNPGIQLRTLYRLRLYRLKKLLSSPYCCKRDVSSCSIALLEMPSPTALLW